MNRHFRKQESHTEANLVTVDFAKNMFSLKFTDIYYDRCYDYNKNQDEDTSLYTSVYGNDDFSSQK